MKRVKSPWSDPLRDTGTGRLQTLANTEPVATIDSRQGPATPFKGRRTSFVRPRLGSRQTRVYKSVQTYGAIPAMATATTTQNLGATALLGKGLTPGKLRGLAADQQPERDADDAGPRSEQLDDRDGAEGAQGQGPGPRADVRGNRRGEARHDAADGPGGLGRADRRLLRRLAGDRLRGDPARTRGCSSGSRSRAARRTRSAARWSRSRRAGASRRSS